MKKLRHWCHPMYWAFDCSSGFNSPVLLYRMTVLINILYCETRSLQSWLTAGLFVWRVVTCAKVPVPVAFVTIRNLQTASGDDINDVQCVRRWLPEDAYWQHHSARQPASSQPSVTTRDWLISSRNLYWRWARLRQRRDRDWVHPNSEGSSLFMAALRSRCGHYIFALWFLSSFFYLFSSPNLSGGRLDV